MPQTISFARVGTELIQSIDCTRKDIDSFGSHGNIVGK